MATMNVLISNTLTRLTMASGVGSQTYAEDRIALAINEAFISVFEMRFWNRYREQTTYALDGTTGVVTSDLTDVIRDFNDIEYVWLSGYSPPLPILPKHVPQSMVRKKSIIPYANAAKVFKVLPADTTGNVIVSYRTRPETDYAEEDDVPMDRFLLVYKACYDILVDEGTNEAGVAKFLSLYNQRLESLEKMEGAQERSLHDYTVADGPNQWQELP